MCQNRGDEVSPWSIVPGWRLETVSWDWLHNVYLGVGRDLVASGIFLFIRQGMYDHYNLQEMDDLLGQIQMDIATFFKGHKFFGFLYGKILGVVLLEVRSMKSLVNRILVFRFKV